MKYNIFSTLSANLNGDTFKILITVFWNLFKTRVLLDEKANSTHFLDILRYMSELITRRCDTRDKTFSILWPKPCLSDSYKISIVIFDKFQKEADLFLIDLMLRRQPLRDLEAEPGLRLISPERTRSNDVQGLTFRKLCVTLPQWPWKAR